VLERLKLFLPYCIYLLSMLIYFIERSTADIKKVKTEDIWYAWQPCQTKPGRPDQNCRGTQSRTGKKVEVESGKLVDDLSQTRDCYLTNGK